MSNIVANSNGVEDPLLATERRDEEYERQNGCSRWLMLFIFCAQSFSNGMLWITFAPISTLTEEYFSISPNQVNMLSVVYMIMYIPGSLLASWFFKEYGCRKGLIAAGFFNALSAWIRCFSLFRSSNADYWFLFTGQLVGATIQPFLTNLPARFTSMWFPLKERDIATTICVGSNPLGVAFGSIISSALVNKNGGMDTLLIFEGIFITVHFVITVGLFEEEPSVPPSRTALLRQISRSSRDLLSEISIRKQIFDCLKDHQFIYLMIGFSFSLGNFNGLSTVINQITRTAGYNEDDASLFGACMIISGMIGAGICGPIMDKYHKYNAMLKVGFLCGTIMTAACLLSIRPNNIAVLASSFGFLGFFMLPVTPVVFNCGVECMYPVEEEITTGLLMSGGQIVGIVITLVLGWFLDKEEDYGDGYRFQPSYILLLSSAVVGNIFIFLYNGPYKRLGRESSDLQN